MLIHKAEGEFFEVFVTRHDLAPRHRVHVLPKLPVAEESHVIGVHCVTRAHLCELGRLIRLAACMVSWLDEGGSVEHWHGQGAGLEARN